MKTQDDFTKSIGNLLRDALELQDQLLDVREEVQKKHLQLDEEYSEQISGLLRQLRALNKRIRDEQRQYLKANDETAQTLGEAFLNLTARPETGMKGLTPAPTTLAVMRGLLDELGEFRNLGGVPPTPTCRTCDAGPYWPECWHCTAHGGV